MLLVHIKAKWSHRLILNSGRSYTTFGTKIPVFGANSCAFWAQNSKNDGLYKNVSRIAKIIHSAYCYENNNISVTDNNDIFNQINFFEVLLSFQFDGQFSVKL